MEFNVLFHLLTLAVTLFDVGQYLLDVKFNPTCLFLELLDFTLYLLVVCTEINLFDQWFHLLFDFFDSSCLLDSHLFQLQQLLCYLLFIRNDCFIVVNTNITIWIVFVTIKFDLELYLFPNLRGG